MSHPPILLFDVMGTLVYDPFAHELPAHFGMTLEQLFAAKHPTAWVDFESGRIDEPTYHRIFFSDGRQYDARALRACMRDAYRWLEGIDALLDDLHRAGAAMHALSNYPAWFEIIEHKLGLSRYMPWTFVSCRTGVRKPDPEAYLGAARTLAVPTSACVFIDDRRVNCAAAEAVGMRAILYTNAPALRRELRALGCISI